MGFSKTLEKMADSHDSRSAMRLFKIFPQWKGHKKGASSEFWIDFKNCF